MLHRTSRLETVLVLLIAVILLPIPVHSFSHQHEVADVIDEEGNDVTSTVFSYAISHPRLDAGVDPWEAGRMDRPSESWFGDMRSEIEVLALLSHAEEVDAWLTASGYSPLQKGPKKGQHLVPFDMPSHSPDDLQHRRLFIPPYLVPKIAALGGLVSIFEPPDPQPFRAHDAHLDPTSVRSGELHGATQAWASNISGEGVKVAVADSGIDFAHPDLDGTQARVSDANSPWDGWPIAFDGASMNTWIVDGDAYPSNSHSWYSDTSSTDNDADGDGELDHSGITLPSQISLSGTYHLGSHPDPRLRSILGGNVDVVVVDDAQSGQYETVYVDTDRDGSIADEHPMRKGSEAGGRDLDGDGLLDRSAGMIYWISDGSSSLPYGKTYSSRYGHADRIPGSGELVMFMINDPTGAGGNHGTLCASAVSAQGVVDGGSVRGMAPNASLIAIANLYTGGAPMFDMWRFVGEGYDGLPDTGDEAQIGSFSFGFSSVVEAGSDASSLYLDHLARTWTPNATYAVAIGNGGHGYGTTASPGGAHSVISVGAFSSRVSEPGGGTWGQSASWSNRGPNSVGRIDPDLVAVGWSATGDETLNEGSDGDDATTSWSGTSLATPVVAGLLALVAEAYELEHGYWPSGSELRDIVMSTADDTYHDPLVQGAGWMNASRAVAAAKSDPGAWWTSPSAWMPGTNGGAHRDANLNRLLPNETSTLSLDLHNPGVAALSFNFSSQVLNPMSHHEWTWDSSSNLGWDGYQNSRPDLLIPLRISGDAANTLFPSTSTMVRARVAMDPLGFDGNRNLESENRVYLKLQVWHDSDGDGVWWSDSNGDGLVGSGELESSSEYSTLTSADQVSPQNEVRASGEWLQEGEGLLLAIWREEVRTSHIDPLPIKIDVTSFGLVPDPWLSLPSNVSIAANQTLSVQMNLTVPPNQLPGITQHGINILDSNGHQWSLPIVASVASDGLSELRALPLDGNVSNQSIYSETWLQGAQHWGWRAESGDWRFITFDWPQPRSERGALIATVDWIDNDFADVDLHWLDQTSHPYASHDPTGYGANVLSYRTGSENAHKGYAIWDQSTFTGTSSERLVVPDTPGLKQLILHSTTHGAPTPDSALNISLAQIAILDGPLQRIISDWRTEGWNQTLQIGSTGQLGLANIDAIGWSKPELLLNASVSQDVATDQSSASLTHPFTVSSAERVIVNLNAADQRADVDLLLYRDKDGDGVIDWGSEQVKVSGNQGPIESIEVEQPPDGLWWAVVHGYSVPMGVTTVRLSVEILAGSNISLSPLEERNASFIAQQWPHGSASLGGGVPDRVWSIDLEANRPASAGSWRADLILELDDGTKVRIPYRVDLQDGEPALYIHGPPSGSAINKTQPISIEMVDYGSGFLLSDLHLGIALPWDSANASAIGLQANGTKHNLTEAWKNMSSTLPHIRNTSIGLLSTVVLQRAWINASVHPLDGKHVVNASLTDIGHHSNYSELSYVLDQISPEISIVSPMANLTLNATMVDVQVTTNEQASVQIGGKNASSLSDYSYWVTGLSIEEGVNEVDIFAIDNAGNSNTTLLTINRDTKPPSLEIVGLPGTWSSNTNWSLEVLHDSDVISTSAWLVNLSGASTLLAMTPYSSNRSLIDPFIVGEGLYEVIVTAVDRAGNQETVHANLSIDFTQPVLVWLEPSSEQLAHHSITIGWDLSEDAYGILTLDGMVITSGIIHSGELLFDWTLGSTGDHELCIELADLANNTALTCRMMHLSESIYNVSIDAPWRNQIVLDSAVSFGLRSGPSMGWTIESAERNMILEGKNSNASILLPLAVGTNCFDVRIGHIDRDWVDLICLERTAGDLALNLSAPVLAQPSNFDEADILVSLEWPTTSIPLNTRLIIISERWEEEFEIKAELSENGLTKSHIIFSVPLADDSGDHILRAVFTDNLGRSVESSLIYNLDHSPPDLVLNVNPTSDQAVYLECNLSDSISASLVLLVDGTVHQVFDPILCPIHIGADRPSNAFVALEGMDSVGNSHRIEIPLPDPLYPAEDVDRSLAKSSLPAPNGTWVGVGILLFATIVIGIFFARKRGSKNSEWSAFSNTDKHPVNSNSAPPSVDIDWLEDHFRD